MKKKNKCGGIVLALLSVLGIVSVVPVCAKNLPSTNVVAGQEVSFRAYIDAVEQYSLSLAAQRESITAAKAGVSITDVRPDPNLSIGIDGKELSHAVNPKLPYGRTLGFDIPIELGGKRDKRIKAAQTNVQLAEATVEGFKVQIYTDAATAFAQACRSRAVLARQEQSLLALSEVVRVNEIRRKAGDLSGLELLQSRTERDRFQAAVFKARADARAALINLSVPLGRRFGELFDDRKLACGFTAFDPGSNVQALVDQAARMRNDVKIARTALDNARTNVELARANRWIDPRIGIGLKATPGIAGGIDTAGNAFNGTPHSRTLSVSLSIPIPLSRMQHGEITQAEAAVTQAMLALQQMELKNEADVHAVYSQFEAARDNVRRYRESVLADTDSVLVGIRLSYRKGAASLLELLSAQRAADETYLDYLQAMADLADATVRLQLSIGQRPNL